MVWIRKLMGWILVAMAVYMVRILIPSELWKSVLTALVPVGASLHLCWFDRTGSGVRRFVFFKRVLGFVLVAAALVYFGVARHSGQALSWVPFEESRMARALQDPKPLILDVYADWCVPCRAMDKKVFADPDVAQLSRKIVMMRLDLTRRKAVQEEVLRKYGIKGVPTILFFNAEGVEVRELRAESYLDKEEFLARLRRILQE
jgi:thiol:disulfide interchange protein DsbD